MTDGLIAPHGGELIVNRAGQAEGLEWQDSEKSLPRVVVGSRQLADLEMLASGAYSPLAGFIAQADYVSVVEEMHLSNGLPWSIPITLAVTSQQAANLVRAVDQDVAVKSSQSRYTAPPT